MIVRHLKDRELQHVLNNRLSELEKHRMKRHLKKCLSCRTRLETFLDIEYELNRLTTATAPPDLADRVIHHVKQLSQIQRKGLKASNEVRHSASSGGLQNRLIQVWRELVQSRDLIHGLVATAATYLFIMSGLVGKIVTLDPDRWGTGVRDGAFQLFQTMETVSRQLLS